MTGNGDVVLALLSGSQAHVAAGLACYFVAIATKQVGQCLTIEVLGSLKRPQPPHERRAGVSGPADPRDQSGSERHPE